jgi:ribose transport system permease protein
MSAVLDRAAAVRPVGRRSTLRWETMLPAGILAALVVVEYVVQPGLFDLFQIGLLLQVALPAVLVAAAQTLVALVRGIDLSVGGIFVVTNAMTATWATHALGAGWAALGAVVVVGLVLGAVNGLLVTVLDLQPFIATLGTWTIYNGIALEILPTDGGSAPAPLATLALAEPLGVPLSIVLLLGLFVAWRLLRASVFGTRMIAVGSDEERARLNGTNVRAVVVAAYALGGALCGLAGIYSVGVTSSGTPSIGDSFILTSVAAVVIGGTRLSGGYGGIGLTMLAALSLILIGDVVSVLADGTWLPVAASSALLLVIVALRAGVAALAERSHR